MFKLIITAALLCAATVANASPYDDAAYTRRAYLRQGATECSTLADVARTTAEARDNGATRYDLQTQVSRSVAQGGFSNATAGIFHTIVDQTFELAPLSPDATAQRFYNACIRTWAGQ